MPTKQRSSKARIVVRDARSKRSLGVFAIDEAVAIAKAYRRRAKQLGKDWRVAVIVLT